jgi:hypothetical protein
MIRVKLLLLSLTLLTAVVANSVTFGSQTAYAQAGQTGGWTAESGQEPADYYYGFLYHIACPAVNSCQAVGTYVDTNSNSHTLIESYDGTGWNLVPNNDPAGDGFSLNDVSCASATFCQAVGSYRDSGLNTRGLIYTYNGTTWTPSNSPQPGSNQYISLSSVDCVSTTFCQAVGQYQNDTETVVHTLIITYNGTSWSVAATADPVDANSAGLSGVDCISVSFCQAVGYYMDTSNVPHTMAQGYNGSTWSVVSSPESYNAGFSVGLNKVKCVTATFCQAIGSFRDDPFTQRAITKSFNGTTWAEATIANENSDEAEGTLSDLDCVSTTLCQAVGSYIEGGTVGHPLLHTYNGSSWSVASIPEPDAIATGILSAVSCPSATNCQALGSYRDTGGNLHSMSESYDGSIWSLAGGIGPANYKSYYTGDVACASPASCQATGSYSGQDDLNHILIGSYTSSVNTVSDNDSTSHTDSQGSSSLLSKVTKVIYPRSSSSTASDDETDTSGASEVAAPHAASTSDSGSALNVEQHKTADATAAATKSPLLNWWLVAAVVGGIVLLAVWLRVFRQNHAR